MNPWVRRLAFLAMVAALSFAAARWRSSSVRPQQALDAAAGRIAAGDSSAAIKMLGELHVPPAMEGERLLLVAAANRQLRRMEESRKALVEASRQPDLGAALEVEQRLQAALRGQFEKSADRTAEWLTDHGVNVADAHAAVLLGQLSVGQTREALFRLEWLQTEYPNAAQTNLIAAEYAQATGNGQEAERLLHNVIRSSPRYELAYIAMVELYVSENFRDLAKTKITLEQASQLFPANTELPVRYASVLRQLGNATLAATILNGVQDSATTASWELVDALADQGRYQAAVSVLETANADEPNLSNQLDTAFGMVLQGRAEESGPILSHVKSAAVDLALGGQPLIAHRLFEKVEDRVARVRRIAELETQHLWFPQLHPSDSEYRATADLDRPFREDATASAEFLQCSAISNDQHREQLTHGLGLYQLHCAQCHGTTGDGLGRAAVFLNPAPRSFVGEPMRYVSASNRLATDDDLRSTIRLGLAGASMPAFPHLSATDVEALITAVRRFQRVGLERQYVAITSRLSQRSGDQLEPLQEWVNQRLVPAGAAGLPHLDETVSADIPKGRQVFEQTGCGHCHAVTTGNISSGPHPMDGKMNPAIFLDSLGRSMLARRLGIDALRRGGTTQELAKRILLGMPGTPHPATDLSPEDVQQLVAYVRSLGSGGLSQGNYQRGYQAFSSFLDR